jgi:hypothetical protein
MLLFFGAYGKWCGVVNSAMMTLQLTGQGQSISQSCREFMFLPSCKICSAANTTCFKINHCRILMTHLHIFLKLHFECSSTTKKHVATIVSLVGLQMGGDARLRICPVCKNC